MTTQCFWPFSWLVPLAVLPSSSAPADPRGLISAHRCCCVVRVRLPAAWRVRRHVRGLSSSGGTPVFRVRIATHRVDASPVSGLPCPILRPRPALVLIVHDRFKALSVRARARSAMVGVLHPPFVLFYIFWTRCDSSLSSSASGGTTAACMRRIKSSSTRVRPRPDADCDPTSRLPRAVTASEFRSASLTRFRCRLLQLWASWLYDAFR